MDVADTLYRQVKKCTLTDYANMPMRYAVIYNECITDYFNGALLTAYLFCLPLKLPHEKERTDPGHLLGPS